MNGMVRFSSQANIYFIRWYFVEYNIRSPYRKRTHIHIKSFKVSIFGRPGLVEIYVRYGISIWNRELPS